MIKRRLVDIILVLLSMAIIAVVWMIQLPSEVQVEDVIENETDTYEVVVTEEDKDVVGDTTEYATESDTEAIEPSESEEGTNTEVAPPESEIEPTEEPEEEVTYYCEWGGFYLTQEEYELLLTTVYCESQTDTKETQYMVALAILNQYNSGKFGSTLRKVIYRKNNFSVTKWDDFENYGWSEKVEESVAKAMKVNKHPRDMYYFRKGHYHKWAKNYKKVGSVYFSTDK